MMRAVGIKWPLKSTEWRLVAIHVLGGVVKTRQPMLMIFYLLVPLTGNIEWEHGVDGTPRKAYTNLVPNQHSIFPVGQHSLASCTKLAIPVEQHMISSPCEFVGNTWHVTRSGFNSYNGKIYFQGIMFFCKWSSLLKMGSRDIWCGHSTLNDL